MSTIVRQVVGIDVAQNELVVALGRMNSDWTEEVYAYKTFANRENGFKALVAWVSKLTKAEIHVYYVMEATGVYHESLAYYLDDQQLKLSIVLPNKISNFFRTLDVKTITDKTSSEAIARFGLGRNLKQWKRPKAIYKRLRQLTRERCQIVEQRTVAMNQLHAEKAEAEPGKSTIARISKLIDFLNKQEKQVRKEITELINQDEEAKKQVKLITSIPGIGELTAATVLSETNGFELITSKKQLTSYAGLDVREKQSGTSVKGKPKISKRGNKYLRKAIHMPALSAIRHDKRLKVIFARLVSRHGIKMKATVAIHRKLLEMTYTIFKKQVPYDKSYLASQQPEAI
jgi:transposase